MIIYSHFHHNTLRNFSYLIVNNLGQCLLIDPFDAEYWKSFLSINSLELAAIFFTHEHPDHYQGEKEFDMSVQRIALSTSNLPFKFQGVNDRDIILEKFTECHRNTFLRINKTPGHCGNHTALELLVDNKLIAFFSGDCLFNAGIGNVKNGGNLKEMHETIMRLKNELSDETVLYPGHDYIERNLKFNLSITKLHKLDLVKLTEIKNEIEKKGYRFLKIKDELCINPFLKSPNFENFKQMRDLRDIF
jgi:hydroxyacylglutathione hydrolase